MHPYSLNTLIFEPTASYGTEHGVTLSALASYKMVTVYASEDTPEGWN